MRGKFFCRRGQIFIMLFFFLGVIVFGQDKAVNEDQKLREEILAAYQSGGEQGLRDLVKKEKDRISDKFIVDFAEDGLKERKEEWLKTCEIMAEEKKDEKTLVVVLYRIGKCFRITANYKKASDYFDKAFPIYLKLNDPVGQGNVYMEKGNIHYYKAENAKALEMYDKALPFYEKVGDFKRQGDVYLGKGDIYYYDVDYARAIEMYNKALTLFEKSGDLIGQGDVYLKKGKIFFYTGDNANAFNMYDKALTFFIAAKDPMGRGNVYFRKGNIFFYTGNSPKALDMYQKALVFLKEAQDFLGQANVYERIGNLYLYTDYNPEALLMYDKALLLFEKVADSLGKGNVYFGKGSFYSHTGDHPKALLMYDKALSSFEEAGDPIGQGNVLRSIGDIYLYTGDSSRAFEMYEKAFPFFEKSRNPWGQGNVYLGEGYIYVYTGDNEKALKMFDKALFYFEKAGFIKGQGDVLLGKGEVYLKVGYHSKALDMFDRALILLEKAKDILNLGNVYHRKGHVYFYTGDNIRAFEMYDKALSFFEKAGTPIGVGNAFLAKGDIYLHLENNSKAIEMYDKAIVNYEKADDPIGQANVLKNKGEIFLRVNEKSKALGMYEKASRLFRKFGDIESESFALYGKAKVLVKLGKKKKALAIFEKAIANQERVRTQTAILEMKRTFMEKVYKQYEETVLFMLENKYYDKGFKYAESMKSRVFLDRMAEELVRVEKGLTQDLNENRDNLVAKLSALNKQIYEAVGGKDEQKLQELKEQYHKTENEFDELLIKIRLENPLYASVRYPEPITVQELQKEVLKKGEILVRYFISPEKLYVFLVSKKKFKVIPLEVKKEEIQGLVEEHLRAIKDNNFIRMKRYGNLLYEKLFKPLEKRVRKSKDIIIVPDGELATIPFESFIVDNNGQDRPEFLLEKYRVKYLQSASLLKILRQHYQKDRNTNSFIGFGDPVYDYENFKLGKPEQGSTKIPATESIFSHEGTRSDTEKKVEVKAEVEVEKGAPSGHLLNASGETLATESTEDEIKELHRDRYARAGGIMDRLPASGEEVKTIARLFEKKSQKSVIRLRDKATEDNANTPEMKDFDYIHFTCHGLLNDDFQSLVLSQLSPDKSKEDGYFTLNEIMNCDYNAKLVVLSACQTGSGKLERAEGVTGMTRAVMYAGTPAVAASLWKVDDEATKELMVKFYENMLEKNLDKAEALRQAKLALIKNKKYRSPLFWSAFVMYGE